MALSASVRLRSAKTWAACSRLELWPTTWPSVISFHVFQIGGAQNWAIVVSLAVRVVLVSSPRLWTSLIAAAHLGLVSAGGGGGRNWLLE